MITEEFSSMFARLNIHMLNGRKVFNSVNLEIPVSMPNDGQIKESLFT